ASSAKLWILLGNGDGTFSRPRTFDLDSSPTSLVVGDFNGNAHADLALVDGDRVGILLGLAQPTLATTAGTGGMVGQSVSDRATLAGGASPTGTITFRAYDSSAPCTAAFPSFTDSVPVSGNGDYTSKNFIPDRAGTYRWSATYSGDANNAPVSSGCEEGG